MSNSVLPWARAIGETPAKEQDHLSYEDGLGSGTVQPVEQKAWRGKEGLEGYTLPIYTWWEGAEDGAKLFFVSYGSARRTWNRLLTSSPCMSGNPSLLCR